MLIQHSAQIIVHRMALLEAKSLEASQVMVAKIRGETMNKQAVERLEERSPAATDPRALDRRV